MNLKRVAIVIVALLAVAGCEPDKTNVRSEAITATTEYHRVVFDTTTTTSTTVAPTTTTSTTVAPTTTSAPPAASVTPTTRRATTTTAQARSVSPSSCPNGTYTNTDGDEVCRPHASSGAPAGATAQCNDGTYSYSQNRRGTCSGHGGVRRWL